jgi:hypothetical protein
MGTSVAQIDATYGHLVPDSDDYLRGRLDNYDFGGAASGPSRPRAHLGADARKAGGGAPAEQAADYSPAL